MYYPLEEKIGHPDLFVGREKEFTFINKWVNNIPRKLSKSRVILARRKSGKTAFIQRLFNQLWSDNGRVIPFYYSVPESNIWYPLFAIGYYRAFASQYISFLERDPKLVLHPLPLEEIKAYGIAKSIQLLVDDVDLFKYEMAHRGHFPMWETAYSAPHRFGSILDQRFLVMIDEFQYLTQFVYPDQNFQTNPIESIPGSFHYHVESKVAPMLVTGSYISWLIDISAQYLEAGRLSRWYMTSYLPPDEGLQAVYKYAELFQEPITNETAVLINQLCLSDPFFISCVVQSDYYEKDLTNSDGVINTVNYEVGNKGSELSGTWAEYINKTLPKINDRHSKQILLYLSKHNDRKWTPREVKEALQLEISTDTIQQNLQLLVEADLLEQGPADIDYQGLQDGTLNLILRSRFEKEITAFEPDLRQDFQAEIEQLQKEKQSLQGKLNNLVGKMAEYQLATKFRSQKRFALSDDFVGVPDTTRLNIMHVQLRVPLQRANGKRMELDLVAESSDNRWVLVEVKKWQKPVGVNQVDDFQEKVTLYNETHPDKIILPAFLSLGGFTKEAAQHCETHGIGMAEKIKW